MYCEIHDSFFRERSLVSPGCYHDIQFEGLVKNPIAQLRATYDALSLGDFAHTELRVQRYPKAVAAYVRNTHLDVRTDLTSGSMLKSIVRSEPSQNTKLQPLG